MQLAWGSAGVFKSQLEQKCGETLSKGAIDKLTSMAVQDAPYAYKDVSMLLETQMKRAPADNKTRLNIFYVLSSICRQSKKRFKEKDKYGPRLASRLETIAGYLSEIATSHWASVGKVVGIWRKEKIFPDAALQHFQGFVGGQADAEATDHLFSPPDETAHLDHFALAAGLDISNSAAPALSAPPSVVKPRLGGEEQQLNGNAQPVIFSAPHNAPVLATPQQPEPLPTTAQISSQNTAAMALPPPPARASEPVSRKRRSRWDAVEDAPNADPKPTVPALLPTNVAAPAELPVPPKRLPSSRWGPPQATDAASSSTANTAAAPAFAEVSLPGVRQSAGSASSGSQSIANPPRAASPDRDPWKLSKALRGQMSTAGPPNSQGAQKSFSEAKMATAPRPDLPSWTQKYAGQSLPTAPAPGPAQAEPPQVQAPKAQPPRPQIPAWPRPHSQPASLAPLPQGPPSLLTPHQTQPPQQQPYGGNPQSYPHQQPYQSQHQAYHHQQQPFPPHQQPLPRPGPGSHPQAGQYGPLPGAGQPMQPRWQQQQQQWQPPPSHAWQQPQSGYNVAPQWQHQQGGERPRPTAGPRPPTALQPPRPPMSAPRPPPASMWPPQSQAQLPQKSEAPDKGDDDMDMENAQELANDITRLATQAFAGSAQAAEVPPPPKRSKWENKEAVAGGAENGGSPGVPPPPPAPTHQEADGISDGRLGLGMAGEGDLQGSVTGTANHLLGSGSQEGVTQQGTTKKLGNKSLSQDKEGDSEITGQQEAKIVGTGTEHKAPRIEIGDTQTGSPNWSSFETDGL